jgi:metal-dependent hydrolase (beta-lactamase superfamily II)
MTDDEFRNRAEKAGWEKQDIDDAIYAHNHDEFSLSYETQLESYLGTSIRNYP